MSGPEPLSAGEIHHVAMSVRDMERTIWFYRDLLGLRMTLDMTVGGEGTEALLGMAPGASGRSVYFQGPTRLGQIEAVQWDLPAPRDWRPRRPGEPGVFLMAFQVAAAELEPLYARLIEAGVESVSAPRTNVLQNYGPISIFVCLDPDGNMVEFVTLPSPEQIKAYRAGAGTGAVPLDG